MHTGRPADCNLTIIWEADLTRRTFFFFTRVRRGGEQDTDILNSQKKWQRAAKNVCQLPNQLMFAQEFIVFVFVGGFAPAFPGVCATLGPVSALNKITQ